MGSTSISYHLVPRKILLFRHLRFKFKFIEILLYINTLMMLLKIDLNGRILRHFIQYHILLLTHFNKIMLIKKYLGVLLIAIDALGNLTAMEYIILFHFLH